MKKYTILILSILILVLANCRDKLEPEVDDFVEYGWVLYEERDFAGAFAEFQSGLDMDSSYADGYNGMGWCYIEFDDADSAWLFFDEGLLYDNDDSSQVRFEMLAGIAFAYHGMGNYNDAIIEAEELHDLNPIFEFSHNFRINFKDIMILIATCYFSEGDFVQSKSWIEDLLVILDLEPDWDPDVSTPQGQAELALMIEELQKH